ncbi:Origin recognition complex subunit 4 [Fasciola gigantica]|uniref:Origin recognition complex subunit 4 n=1 Tax=Fasciola gigantica TaxID=46835 RepID=A0A504YCW1_FASGI|nr:Origin recognition complex subunit 4 [Fasciola gigantica]
MLHYSFNRFSGLSSSMDFVLKNLRRRLFRSRHATVLLEDELKRLKQTIQSLVIHGESNSLLIVGRRGVGKKSLLSQALQEVKEDPLVRKNLLKVELNGLVHTDDRHALRAMARQLHRESLLSESTESLDENSIGLPFSQQLQWFLEGLRSGEGASMSLLIVLYEFDLFALHRNQILLYNLFDCCQCTDTPICVIGVTCRLIHLTSVAAPLDHRSSYGDDESEDAKSPAFKHFCQVCRHFLAITVDEIITNEAHIPIASVQREIESAVKVWNHHVSELLSDEIVVDSLRQAWSVSVSLRRLINLLVPIVARLGSDKTRIEPVEFIDSLCALRQDAKINSLSGLCILELLLIATLVKLQDISASQPVNFEVLYSEYAKFCRTQCPSYLYDKPVVFKALDNLIGSELVVCGKEAVAISASNNSYRTANSAVIQMPNYKPLFSFVNTETLTECLDAYPNCPVELRFWVHSRTY